MNAEEETKASGAAATSRRDEAPPGADGAGADDGPSPFKKRRIEEVKTGCFFLLFWKSFVDQVSEDPFGRPNLPRVSAFPLSPPRPRLSGCRSAVFISLLERREDRR